VILRKMSKENLIYFRFHSIHPSVVLTAAHKVHTNTPNQLVVRAGAWDIFEHSEILADQTRDVASLVVHEQFSSGSKHYNIALLFLSIAFDSTLNIATVCLPPPNYSFDNLRCLAIGWGKNEFGSDGKYQRILKKISLPIVAHNECQDKMRTTRLSYVFQLHESFLCAGGEEGLDTCTGDGGSPLVCPIIGMQGRYYQAGVVAWVSCCYRKFIVYLHCQCFAGYWMWRKSNSRCVWKNFGFSELD
jgi:secreted trypsin-like serine protease